MNRHLPIFYQKNNEILNILESSKAVIDTINNQVNLNRNLDFDCLTERLAVMSYPSESSLELSTTTNRNYIEDIKTLMEKQYPSHYTVINVTPDERTYPMSKFPTGKVIHANWSSTPSMMSLIDTANDVINFLRVDKENVAVIHDLDGKSNAALLASAILLQCQLFESSSEALNFFELKRCPPCLSNGQRRLLANYECLKGQFTLVK